MQLTMKKKIDSYQILEKGRVVFTAGYEKEGKLLSLTLYNMFQDPVLQFYQLRKRFPFSRTGMDFVVYEDEREIGSILKKKDGYELVYHDVYYRFYSGLHAGKRTVICFDKQRQIGEFILDEISEVTFKNTTLQGLLALMMMLMKAFLDQEQFSQEAFLHHYVGVYHDADSSAA